MARISVPRPQQVVSADIEPFFEYERKVEALRRAGLRPDGTPRQGPRTALEIGASNLKSLNNVVEQAAPLIQQGRNVPGMIGQIGDGVESEQARVAGYRPGTDDIMGWNQTGADDRRDMAPAGPDATVLPAYTSDSGVAFPEMSLDMGRRRGAETTIAPPAQPMQVPSAVVGFDNPFSAAAISAADVARQRLAAMRGGERQIDDEANGLRVFYREPNTITRTAPLMEESIDDEANGLRVFHRGNDITRMEPLGALDVARQRLAGARETPAEAVQRMMPELPPPATEASVLGQPEQPQATPAMRQPVTLRTATDEQLAQVRDRLLAQQGTAIGSNAEVVRDRLRQIDQEMAYRQDQKTGPVEFADIVQAAQGADSAEKQQQVLAMLPRSRLTLDDILSGESWQDKVDLVRKLFPDVARLRQAEARAVTAEGRATLAERQAALADERAKTEAQLRDPRARDINARAGLNEGEDRRRDEAAPFKNDLTAAQTGDVLSRTTERDALLPGKLALQKADELLTNSRARAAELRAKLAAARGARGGGRKPNEDARLLADVQAAEAKDLAAVDEVGKETRTALQRDIDEMEKAIATAESVPPPRQLPRAPDPDEATEDEMKAYQREREAQQREQREYERAQAVLRRKGELSERRKELSDTLKQLDAARKQIQETYAEPKNVGRRIVDTRAKRAAGVAEPAATPAPRRIVDNRKKPAAPAAPASKPKAEDFLD